MATLGKNLISFLVLYLVLNLLFRMEVASHQTAKPAILAMKASNIYQLKLMKLSLTKDFNFWKGRRTDSASSISVSGFKRENVACSSSNWELEYVMSILDNAELTFEEFALCQSPKVIMPLNLFDQLENERAESVKYLGDYFKIERKVWFECVNECLEAKCVRHFSGSSKEWIKWRKYAERKELLAEESQKEVSGRSKMGELMVDEVVDKEMSSEYGKWVEFEVEAFEEGVEIETEILSSLIDEFVADLIILPFS